MLEPLSFLTKGKQQPAKEPLGDDGSWLLTMSDFTLLILCALLVWYIVEKRQTDSSRTSLTAAATALVPATLLPQVLPPSTDTPTPLRLSPQSGGVPSIGKEQETLPAFIEQWGVLKTEMEAYVIERGLGESVDIVSTQHELRLALKDKVLFASGQADLRSSILPALDKVAALARKHPDLVVEVLGHTDDVPIITPEFPSNWELSAARASRVARHLIKAGALPTQVSTQGYASFRPTLPNTSDENRATNRRVEIRFYRGIEHATANNKAQRRQVHTTPTRADLVVLPEPRSTE